MEKKAILVLHPNQAGPRTLLSALQGLSRVQNAAKDRFDWLVKDGQSVLGVSGQHFEFTDPPLRPIAGRILGLALRQNAALAAQVLNCDFPAEQLLKAPGGCPYIQNDLDALAHVLDVTSIELIQL